MIRLALFLIVAAQLCVGTELGVPKWLSAEREADAAAACSSSQKQSERRDEARRKSAVRCVDCERDAQGRIRRSAAAVRAFRDANPCPATGKTKGACPGYEVHHIRPLADGGKDEPANMEWLTIKEHDAKHRKR